MTSQILIRFKKIMCQSLVFCGPALGTTLDVWWSVTRWHKNSPLNTQTTKHHFINMNLILRSLCYGTHLWACKSYLFVDLQRGDHFMSERRKQIKCFKKKQHWNDTPIHCVSHLTADIWSVKIPDKNFISKIVSQGRQHMKLVYSALLAKQF